MIDPQGVGDLSGVCRHEVSEIKTKSKPEKEWFWIPGELNPADMGTRPTVVPRDMGPEPPTRRDSRG